jgi:hypothetical protein
MMPLKKTGIRCATALGAALLVAWGATPAQATVVERGTFADSENGVPDTLCGISLDRDSTSSGS